MPAALVVAIDGPSGSGKSSVSREVAAQLGLAYLDTGAMYRALTWWCHESGVDLQDRAAVAAAAHSIPLRMLTDPQGPGVLVNGIDIDRPIRSAAVTAAVSQVATNPQVRTELARRQRQIMDESGGIVAEGRDITTVVAPDADVRILLTADPTARMRRRAAEMTEQVDAAALRDQVIRRDSDDATVSEFSTAADGVYRLDSTDLDFSQTVATVLRIVHQAGIVHRSRDRAPSRPRGRGP